MKPWVFVAAGCLLAGCAVPPLGTVSPAREVRTAPGSVLISGACREAVSLVEGPAGVSQLNAADSVLGDPTISSGDAAAVVASVVWGAKQVGITDCG